MLQFRINHGRGLWQVLKMVRAHRSTQMISYVDEKGQEQTYHLQISCTQPFAEIADPLIAAIFDLLDSLDLDGRIPAEKLHMSYWSYAKIALFLSQRGTLNKTTQQPMTFEDLCREVLSR